MPKPCSATPGKVQHPTRDAALEHLKQLVFKDASRDRSSESRGLHVYECDACGAWHVGHAQPAEVVWHYAPATLLDIVTDTGRIPLPEPRAFLPVIDEQTRRGGLDTRDCFIRLSRSFMKRYPSKLPPQVVVHFLGRRLTLSRDFVVRHPVIWFSRDERWDYVMNTTPAMLIARAQLELEGEGLARFGVSPSLAPLRWDDYLKRNPMSEEARGNMNFAGEPTNWLASDTEISLDKIRRIEVYYNGAWTPVTDVEPDDFERYVGSRREVYRAAYPALRKKQKAAPDATAPKALTRLFDLRPEMTARKLLDWQIDLLQLTEPERILFEDDARIYLREGREESEESAS